jgi:hypothetical protein
MECLLCGMDWIYVIQLFLIFNELFIERTYVTCACLFSDACEGRDDIWILFKMMFFCQFCYNIRQ